MKSYPIITRKFVNFNQEPAHGHSFVYELFKICLRQKDNFLCHYLATTQHAARTILDVFFTAKLSYKEFLRLNYELMNLTNAYTFL